MSKSAHLLDGVLRLGTANLEYAVVALGQQRERAMEAGHALRLHLASVCAELGTAQTLMICSIRPRLRHGRRMLRDTVPGRAEH
eukprot:713064-Pyramimonas_sp.AAC.1